MQKILLYWVCPSWWSDSDLHGERWKDCHGRKCTETASTVMNDSDWLSQEGSDTTRLVYAERIRLFGISGILHPFTVLILHCISSSFDLYIALESLSHLIVWPTKHLPSFFLFFFFFPQYDSSVLFFSSHPFGFSSSPWDLGKDFSQLKKKIHTISQSLYQTYALMRQKESQWWFLSHSKKYNTFMHCIVGIYRKFAICYGKTESVDEDGKWDPWNLYSTYCI